MKTHSTKKIATWLLFSIPAVLAHTWVEQLSVIAPNGTFVGAPGYSRGYMSRTETGFEDTMVYLLPPDGRANELLPTDTICKSTQGVGNQTAGFPTLKASPGDNIALRYQENGHVTLPDSQIGKPANRGTVYIYGTTKSSSSDTILDIHRVWNSEGTGGDGRGVLLATRNFDDGQCYQVNGGNISTARQQQFPHDNSNALMGVNLWCQTDVQLPTNITGDTYSIYWVWDWPTLPNVTGSGEPDGKIEIYTTCMDISMTPANTTPKEANTDVSFIVGQQLDYAAIQDQLTKEFQVTTSTSDPYTTFTTGSVPATSAPAVIASTAPAAELYNSSVAAGRVTVTVTVTQPAPVVTVQPSTMVTSVVTQYTTITANVNAVTEPSLSESQNLSVTPFLQSTVTDLVSSTITSTSTLTSIVPNSASTNAPGINGTSSNIKKMLRSHIARRLH